MMSANKFNIFNELIIGGLSKEHLIQKLSEAGIPFNKYSNTLFEHPQFSLVSVRSCDSFRIGGINDSNKID